MSAATILAAVAVSLLVAIWFALIHILHALLSFNKDILDHFLRQRREPRPLEPKP